METTPVLEAVRDLLTRHSEVHVLTSRKDQAHEVSEVLSVTSWCEPSFFIGGGPDFPDGPVVVAVGSDVCFHYMRAHVMQFPTGTPVRERILGAGAVLVGISQGERDAPCRIVDCQHPRADGTCALLAWQPFGEFLGLYGEAVDLNPAAGED